MTITQEKDHNTYYVYDTWGKVLSVSGSLASTVGVKNPIRYRGYYYDTETELYYLSSRYYDPEVGRFISPDIMENLNPEGIDGLNLYAYCLNNPVNLSDSTGCSPWYDTWWGKTLIGIGIVAGTALCVAAIVASAGTAGALVGLGAASLGFSATAVSTIATVATIGTYVVAGGVGLFGLSDAVEVWSGGTNPIRDWVMGGNQTAYNVTRGVFDTLGTVAVLAGTFGPRLLKGSGPKGYKKDFFDRKGNWSARLDATTHGHPKYHHNPHVHFGTRGGGGQGIYYWWEIIRRLFS